MTCRSPPSITSSLLVLHPRLRVHSLSCAILSSIRNHDVVIAGMESQRRTCYGPSLIVYYLRQHCRRPCQNIHAIARGIHHLLTGCTPSRLLDVDMPRRHHPLHTATHKSIPVRHSRYVRLRPSSVTTS